MSGINSQKQKTFYLQYGKGIFDRACALFGLIALAPFVLFIAAAIKIDSAGPIFYGHPRVGRHKNLFKLYKFRSMVQGASKMGLQVTKGGDPRITGVGKILRKYKLDELPQLINVLLGDISMVGPRPEVKKYVDMFWQDYKDVLTIKPGITDYAALTFRNEEEVLARYSDMEQGYISEVLPKKIELYKEYINRISFGEDLRIIFLTLWKIVR